MPTKKPTPEGEWLLLSSSEGLTYRKEAIYLGDWAKLDSKGDGLEFSTYRDTLEHWSKSVGELRGNGIDIPLSTTHDGWESSENKLASIIGAKVEKNQKGVPSLFLDIKFDDEKSRDTAIKADISIGSPPVFHDAKKRRYVYPLRHVASTAAPVIPGLETWQAIAASFSNEGKTMEPELLAKLISLLKVEVSEEQADDTDAKLQLVTTALDKALEDQSKGGDTMPAETTELSEEGGTGSPAPQASKVTVAFSQSPLMVTQVRKGRQSELDGYVAQNKLSPAVAAKLAEVHCSEGAIKLALDSNDDDSAFEGALGIALMASSNRPMSDSGRSDAVTDGEVIELAHGNKGTGLVAAAEARAEEFKESRV